MDNVHNLEELYTKYKPQIYSYLYYQTGSSSTSEELCQEVFLRAFKGIQSFRGDSSVKTWLYTIAHNLFVSWKKREVKYNMVAIEDANEAELISLSDIPEEAVEKRERIEKVRTVLNKLKEEYRMVIVLCDAMELSYSEIAELMNWNLSKVKITIYRARIQFKTLYESEGDAV